MPWRITPSTTLDDARREARRWLKALRANDASARARFDRALSEPPAAPTLRDVQHALAREQGFEGWTAIKAHLGSSAGRTALEGYERMAANLLDAFRTGTPEAMERHWHDTWHRRAWPAMRRYVLADLGRQSADEGQREDITLDDARWLVARGAAFESWGARSEFAAGAAQRRPLIARPVDVVADGAGDSPDDGERARDWETAIERLLGGRFTGLHANGQMTDPALERISRVAHVTSLRLAGSAALSDDGLRHLANMPQLRHLDLGGCAITDRGLAVLRELPALETLSLADTRTTDAGAAHLAHCDRLREVDLTWTRTGDGALAALAGKPALCVLRSGVDVTDAGLSLLEQFPSFRTWRGGEPAMALLSAEAGPTYLSLRARVTDAGLARLAALEGLFALHVHDRRMPITAAGLRALASMPNLGWLAYEADDEAMAAIAALPALRFLLSQDSATTDDGWAALGRSQTLEYIWGRDSGGLARRGFRALASMPALRGLSVNLSQVDDEAMSLLPSFPALRELMPIAAPDEAYRHVGRCARLESLVLMYCRETTDRATEHIAHLPALRKYFASYTRITDRTPELLARVASLEEIELYGCAGITNRGIAALAGLPALRELRLSGLRNADRRTLAAFRPGVRVRWST